MAACWERLRPMRERKVRASGTKGVGGGMWDAAIWDLRWRKRVRGRGLERGGRRRWMGGRGLESEGRRKDGREIALGCRVIMAQDDPRSRDCFEGEEDLKLLKVVDALE